VQGPANFRGAFRTDDNARAVYSEAAGIARAWPKAVAVPVDAEDATTLVRWARSAGLPLIPRGSGSSMAGGVIGDAVVVDLSRLQSLGAVSVQSRSVRGGAGVIRGTLDRAARAVGLRFPVDPSSGEFCTIGGMASTNAAGPHSLLHGSMRPWVQALECVLDDGSLVTIRRGASPASAPAIQRFMQSAHGQLGDASRVSDHAGVLKDSSGYATSAYSASQELVDLFVGSEGTLGLITAVEVGLIPVAAAHANVLVAFDDLERAVEAAVQARESGVAVCELLDRTFLGIAATGGHPLPVAADSEAVLLVEIESHDERDAVARATELGQTWRALGATESIVAAEPQRAAELWSLRHAASPALARMDPRLKSMQFIEDAAVPPPALAAYVNGVRRALAAADTPGVIFGHAGDAHVHVNPLVDVGRADWRSRVDRILTDVTELVAQLGGTLTGEHGDGRLRTPLLGRVWGVDARAGFAAIKHAFDPTGLFNPGVKVDASGQEPIGDVKYDPTLPELPAAARRALAEVERDRGYARFRLDLL
jgi:FAD/FMN-containing dehydrogenase